MKDVTWTAWPRTSTSYPRIVNELRVQYERYWESVREADEEFGRPLIDPADPDPVVLCAEHLFPDQDDAFVWNQQHVLVAKPITGRWPVRVAAAGRYRIERRRWPEEVDAPIRGVPAARTSDVSNGALRLAARPVAFLWDEDIGETLYGAQDGGEPTPINGCGPRCSTLKARS